MMIFCYQAIKLSKSVPTTGFGEERDACQFGFHLGI